MATRIGGSNKILRAKDVAELIGFTVDTVYDNWRKWDMPGFYVGRNLCFRERDVDAWIENQAA